MTHKYFLAGVYSVGILRVQPHYVLFENMQQAIVLQGIRKLALSSRVSERSAVKDASYH